MAKWYFLFFVVIFAYHAMANNVSEPKPKVERVSKSALIKQVQILSKQQNLDSLERVFSVFVKEKIERNLLDEGHAVLNHIISDKASSDTLKILAYKHKAVLYGQIDLTKKREAFESAVEIIESKTCLYDLLPLYQMEVAKTYISQSRFLDATLSLNKIDFDAITDPEKKVELMGVTGLLYMKIDDNEKALNILNDALKIAEKNKDYFGLGTIHSSIGNLYSTNLKQFDKAKYHFRSSMIAFEKAGYPHYALGSQADLGFSYAKLENYDSAFYYLEISYDEAIKIGSTYDQAICAKELGILYNKLNQPKIALRYCDEAKELNWDYGGHNFRASCAACLAKAYESLNDFEAALKYLKLNQIYADSNSNKAQANALAKFNAELEKQVFVAEQEKLNLEKDQVLKTRNLWITFLGVLSILIVVIFLLILWVVKNRKKREVIELKERSQREYVKSLLQSLEDERKRVSMELHDSVGQILVVAGRNVSNQQFDHVGPMLQNALNEVRTISQGLHPYILEKMGLQDAILNLIDAVDNSHDVFIDSDVDLSQSGLNKEQEIHLYRIVQELISNCLKHAQSPSLQIEITSNASSIKIVVSDNGKGFDADEILTRKTMSLGMKTLHERVELLRGTIHFDSKPNHGTTVTINLAAKP